MEGANRLGNVALWKWGIGAVVILGLLWVLPDRAEQLARSEGYRPEQRRAALLTELLASIDSAAAMHEPQPSWVSSYVELWDSFFEPIEEESTAASEEVESGTPPSPQQGSDAAATTVRVRMGVRVLEDLPGFEPLTAADLEQAVSQFAHLRWDRDAPTLELSYSQERHIVQLHGVGALQLATGTDRMPLVVGTDESPWQGSRGLPKPSSALPPLIAIAFALITRRAVASLLAGVVAAAALMSAEAFSQGLFGGIVSTGTQGWGLLSSQIFNATRFSIVLFVLFLVGMVGVMTTMGGVQGVVNWLMRYSSGARSSRVVTVLLGFLVFFDDYSNSVIVGSSMRPMTDKLRVSREKLAYLIDSTAAPVAGIALFSTWIGYEVGQYQVALEAIRPELGGQAYAIFLQTIPLRFYCCFTLIFVLGNALLSRDFGPMWEAERRAAEEGKVIRDGANPLTSKEFSELSVDPQATPLARNALVPLGVVLVTMVLGIWIVGRGVPYVQQLGWGAFSKEIIAEILQTDYAMQATVVASFLGGVVAISMAVLGGHVSWGKALRAWTVGFKSIGVAIAILIAAWALAEACGRDRLQTGAYLGALLGENLPLMLAPVMVFLLSCVVAFATGSSWGTMAILLPITIPWVAALEGWTGPGEGVAVTLLTMGAVLEGSIFGDHCSPISDTTVLASVSAGSDHIDHVKTQLPYAMTTMLISIVCGYLPVAYGLYSWWVALLVGSGVAVGVLIVIGRPTPEGVPNGSPAGDGEELLADSANRDLGGAGGGSAANGVS